MTRSVCSPNVGAKLRVPASIGTKVYGIARDLYITEEAVFKVDHIVVDPGLRIILDFIDV